MIRVPLLGLVFLLSANAAFAKCASEWMTVWPEGDILMKNPVIIIEGHGDSGPIVQEMEKYALYLESESDRVALRVKEKNTGEFRISQALLVPVRELTAGQTYTLKGEGLEKDALAIWNNGDREEKTWKVKDKGDTTPPVWENLPGYIGSEVKRLGCGPSVFSFFSAEVADENEVVIEVRLRSSGSPETEKTYYLRPEKGKVSVGHGMCSGAFRLDSEKEYRIELAAMDAAGNKTAAPGEPVVFTGPKFNYRVLGQE